MILLILLQLDYAAETIKREIVSLESQRAALVQQQTELKVDYSETVKQLDDAIANLQTDRAKLSARDDADAIALIDREIASLQSQKAALESVKQDIDQRNLVAEIAEIDRKIAALTASLNKLKGG